MLMDTDRGPHGPGSNGKREADRLTGLATWKDRDST